MIKYTVASVTMVPAREENRKNPTLEYAKKTTVPNAETSDKALREKLAVATRAEQLTEYDRECMWNDLQLKRPTYDACIKRLDWDVRERYS